MILKLTISSVWSFEGETLSETPSHLPKPLPCSANAGSRAWMRELHLTVSGSPCWPAMCGMISVTSWQKLAGHSDVEWDFSGSLQKLQGYKDIQEICKAKVLRLILDEWKWISFCWMYHMYQTTFIPNCGTSQRFPAESRLYPLQLQRHMLWFVWKKYRQPSSPGWFCRLLFWTAEVMI